MVMYMATTIAHLELSVISSVVLHHHYQLETCNKTNFTVRNTGTYVRMYSLEIMLHSFPTRVCQINNHCSRILWCH